MLHELRAGALAVQRGGAVVPDAADNVDLGHEHVVEWFGIQYDVLLLIVLPGAPRIPRSWVLGCSGRR